MFGSHLSIAGALSNALDEAESLGLDTVQVFTKNQRQWKTKPLDSGARDAWLARLDEFGWNDRTVAHDSYLINLASPDDELWAAHLQQKAALQNYARVRLRRQLARHGEAPYALAELGDILDPGILTIGFARPRPGALRAARPR